MVDADREVDLLLLKLRIGFGCGGESIGHGDAIKVCGLLPLGDKVRRDAGQADTQTVLERDDRDAAHARYAADVCAEAHGVKLAQIALYLGLAVVKIVIAEGDEVIAAEVQKP